MERKGEMTKSASRAEIQRTGREEIFDKITIKTITDEARGNTPDIL